MKPLSFLYLLYGYRAAHAAGETPGEEGPGSRPGPPAAGSRELEELFRCLQAPAPGEPALVPVSARRRRLRPRRRRGRA